MPFKKGQSGNPDGRPEGAKGKATLLKEERRAIFDQEVSQMWKDTIKQMKPEYLGDQFMGKAVDKLEVEAKVDNTVGLSEEVIVEAKRLLKERMAHGDQAGK